MARLDLVDPNIQGNKYWKLKYHFIRAKEKGLGISAIGGPYSNLLHSLAIGGKLFGIKTRGILKGPEPKSLTPTLSDCRSYGMELEFIKREAFKNLNLQLQQESNYYKDDFFVPLGADDKLGLMGTREIMNSLDFDQKFLAVPVGSGSTLKGLALTKPKEVFLNGFMAPGFDKKRKTEIENELKGIGISNFSLTNFEVGAGFGKFHEYEKDLILEFEKLNGLKLDPIYTYYMVACLEYYFNKGVFDDPKEWIAIHTGGLQGRRGFSFLEP